MEKNTQKKTKKTNKKNSQFVKKKVFFNHFDKSQEAMLKISMEMLKSLFFIQSDQILYIVVYFAI